MSRLTQSSSDIARHRDFKLCIFLPQGKIRVESLAYLLSTSDSLYIQALLGGANQQCRALLLHRGAHSGHDVLPGREAIQVIASYEETKESNERAKCYLPFSGLTSSFYKRIPWTMRIPPKPATHRPRRTQEEMTRSSREEEKRRENGFHIKRTWYAAAAAHKKLICWRSERARGARAGSFW
jgi:hypothetical protein